jgi:hypothetical protein
MTRENPEDRSSCSGEEPDAAQPPTPDVPKTVEDAAGRQAEDTNGAVRGSGQSTGHGNPGEEPDSDPVGGDGSSLIRANLKLPD